MVPSRSFIGLASGSCADGVDAVLLETEGLGLDLRVRPLSSLHRAYPADLRELLLRLAASRPAEVRDVALLHRLLGETFAAAARQVADQARFRLHEVQAIGCPGHTIWHDADGRFPCTLTLGIPAIVAERTGVSVVSDFRARDLAAGGHGAAPELFVDYLLFRHPQENRLLIHLGAAATVVFLPAQARLSEVLAFDAGPCNLLLDALMRQVTNGRESCDRGGKHAVCGRCLDPLLQRWLEHPYLQRRPPKALPRHYFDDAFAAQAVHRAREAQAALHDLLCTAIHFIARGVTGAVRRFLPGDRPLQRVLVSGGGVRNGFLWQLLSQQLGHVPLERIDVLGVPAEARKPLCYGVLAALALDQVPANLPAATQAAGARLLGSFTPGSALHWSRCLAWMASQSQPLPHALASAP